MYFHLRTDYVVHKVHTSAFPSRGFAGFFFLYVKINHFQDLLIASSRVVDANVLRMVIQFDYCFIIRRQNGEHKVRNLRRFFFGMSPDVPTFKF